MVSSWSSTSTPGQLSPRTSPWRSPCVPTMSVTSTSHPVSFLTSRTDRSCHLDMTRQVLPLVPESTPSIHHRGAMLDLSKNQGEYWSCSAARTSMVKRSRCWGNSTAVSTLASRRPCFHSVVNPSDASRPRRRCRAASTPYTAHTLTKPLTGDEPWHKFLSRLERPTR